MREIFAMGFSLVVLISYSQSDSLIIVQGKIFNAQTKEPVSARITYQSLPYGNRVGVINNNNFSFPIVERERYSIVVEANGYSTAKYMIDPAEADSDNKLIKDIPLEYVSLASTSDQVGKVVRLNNLIFEVAKSKIDPESFSELDMVVAMMNDNKNMVVQLEGHTDYLGDAAKNQKLSEQRVEAVRDYLVSKGIKKSRIKLKAFGGSMPLSRDNTPEGHRLNRRVEMRILKS